jgi:UDP-N-acetylglucosamine diphosphorylase/glucosamine-1-phosphate N-acetyltransferase
MELIDKHTAVIILAAGLGKRMKSDKAKVLQKILNKPMVMYVIETAKKVARDDVIVVIGNQAEKVRKIVSESQEVIFALQKSQLGTGHAVICALPHIPDHIGQVIILCGDVPVLKAGTVNRLLNDHKKAKRDITLLATEIDNPKGYGRIVFDKKGCVVGIVEEVDATEEQKKIKTINTGIYCVKKDFLFNSLKKIGPDNLQKEFYLTDIVGVAHEERKNIGVVTGTDFEEFMGVNDPRDLVEVENIMRRRLTYS